MIPSLANRHDSFGADAHAKGDAGCLMPESEKRVVKSDSQETYEKMALCSSCRSGCFRPSDRLAGWDLHPLEIADFHGILSLWHYELRDGNLAQSSCVNGPTRYQSGRCGEKGTYFDLHRARCSVRGFRTMCSPAGRELVTEHREKNTASRVDTN